MRESSCLRDTGGSTQLCFCRSGSPCHVRKINQCLTLLPAGKDFDTRFRISSVHGTYLSANGYTRYNELKDFKRCHCYTHIKRYFPFISILVGRLNITTKREDIP